MERKIFYSMVKRDGLIGVVMRDGFEVEIDGEKYNAFVSEYETAYIVDPKTGRSISEYDPYACADDVGTDMEIIKAAVGRLIEKLWVLDAWKKKRQKAYYPMMVRMFEALREGVEIGEKLDQELKKEKREAEHD